MPGRLFVHRCPSRFTYRAVFVIGFFATFFTATCSPSKTLPDTLRQPRIQSDFS